MKKAIGCFVIVVIVACWNESSVAETVDFGRGLDPVEAFYDFFGQDCENRAGKNHAICENDMSQKKVTIGCMQSFKGETKVSIVELPGSDKAWKELVQLSCFNSFERTEKMSWRRNHLYIVW